MYKHLQFLTGLYKNSNICVYANTVHILSYHFGFKNQTKIFDYLWSRISVILLAQQRALVFLSYDFRNVVIKNEKIETVRV